MHISSWNVLCSHRSDSFSPLLFKSLHDCIVLPDLVWHRTTSHTNLQLNHCSIHQFPLTAAAGTKFKTGSWTHMSFCRLHVTTNHTSRRTCSWLGERRRPAGGNTTNSHLVVGMFVKLFFHCSCLALLRQQHLGHGNTGIQLSSLTRLTGKLQYSVSWTRSTGSEWLTCNARNLQCGAF